jgi:hypothetical protein
MSDEEFLLTVIDYIQETEVRNDQEWGLCRSLSELVTDNAMPGVYAEALRRLRIRREL